MFDPLTGEFRLNDSGLRIFVGPSCTFCGIDGLGLTGGVGLVGVIPFSGPNPGKRTGAVEFELEP